MLSRFLHFAFFDFTLALALALTALSSRSARAPSALRLSLCSHSLSLCSLSVRGLLSLVALTNIIQMESKGTEGMRKRVKPTVEETEPMVGDKAVDEIVEEETEINPVVSEQMELDISHILEKINRFTQLVSELLESGKSLLKELSNEFEERVILIHKEQIEKWQEEIKELRMLDASNEDVNALLHSAQYLLQNVHTDS
ncbi:unnamed protein product [Camellia sinensis]